MVQYLCLHGYVRGVCAACADPGHNCQAPRLKKQVARLKGKNEELRRMAQALETHHQLIALAREEPCSDCEMTDGEIRRALRKR